MFSKFKNVLIGVLALGVVVLAGVAIYQRLVINQELKLIIEMYQFIQEGCPFSQLH
jgi:hypothetical protein